MFKIRQFYIFTVTLAKVMAPYAVGPNLPVLIYCIISTIFTTFVSLATHNHKTLPWYVSFANLLVFIVSDSNCRNSSGGKCRSRAEDMAVRFDLRPHVCPVSPGL